MTSSWSTITATTAVISHARLGFVVAAFAVDMLSLVVMAFRWRLLLHGVGSRTSLWETLLAYSAGVCVCNITPARTLGGDACRAVLIRRPDGRPPVKAIAASVVYDRATDIPGFLLLGLVGLPVLMPKSPHWVLLALLALIVAVVARPIYSRLVSRLARWHRWMIGGKMDASIAAAVGCSLTIWLLDITRVMLVGRAFDVRLFPSQAAAVSLVRLGSGLVPIPGGIGVVDGALVGSFVWLHLPAATAIALAVVERAIVFGWATLLGAAALLLLGGVRALKKARNAAPLFDTASNADA
jgi:uncharacterized membrane protein YbhN (UPF0104 family)